VGDVSRAGLASRVGPLLAAPIHLTDPTNRTYLTNLACPARLAYRACLAYDRQL